MSVLNINEFGIWGDLRTRPVAHVREGAYGPSMPLSRGVAAFYRCACDHRYYLAAPPYGVLTMTPRWWREATGGELPRAFELGVHLGWEDRPVPPSATLLYALAWERRGDWLHLAAAS